MILSEQYHSLSLCFVHVDAVDLSVDKKRITLDSLIFISSFSVFQIDSDPAILDTDFVPLLVLAASAYVRWATVMAEDGVDERVREERLQAAEQLVKKLLGMGASLEVTVKVGFFFFFHFNKLRVREFVLTASQVRECK